ncbi:MAG: hypothetical protein MUC67_03575 [Acidobacteria bacterium]|nr:hypothetical protein [Acidobacteriota bacterium]
MMRRFALVLAALAAALGPQPGLALKPGPAPEMKLLVTQAPDPLRVGQPGVVRVLVQPPDGITLNRYPGITLTVEKSSGVALARPESFVGTKTPIEDPAEFAFKKIEPLELPATAQRPGTAELEGTLVFTYCVKASGFCAPAKQKVKLAIKTAR